MSIPSIIRQDYQPTTLDDWERSDKYHNSFLIPPDPALEAAAKRSDERGLPEIAVSPAQGKFLNLLAQSIGAKKILEVGTLGGYACAPYMYNDSLIAPPEREIGIPRYGWQEPSRRTAPSSLWKSLRNMLRCAY